MESLKTWISSRNLIFADTETTGLDPHTCEIICLVIGDGEDYFLISDPTILPEIVTHGTWVFHNAVFDFNFLRKYCRKLPIDVWDTMIAEKILNQGLRIRDYSLSDLSYEYTGKSLDKTLQSSFVGQTKQMTDAQIDYAFSDVEILPNIYKQQKAKLKELELEKVESLEMQVVKVLADMSWYGIVFNKEKWLDLYDKNLIERDKALQDLLSYIKNKHPEFAKKHTKPGDLFSPEVFDFNPNSPAEILILLKLEGITVIGEDGKETASGKLLASLHSKNEFVKLYLRFKKYSHRVTSFGTQFIDKYYNEKTKRVYSKYNQLINTGRISSGDKNENKANLQNIPAEFEFRAAFEAPPTHKVICADFSGQESKVIVSKSKDPELVDFYRLKKHGGDMHSFVAQIMYKVEVPPKIEDDPEALEYFNNHPNKKLRNSAKSLNFKLAYGGTAFSLQTDLNVSLEEAEEIVRIYFENFKGMKNYMDIRREEIYELGYILTNEVTGRKIFISEQEIEQARRDKSKITDPNKKTKLMGELERASINYPIQGTSADITKTALVMLYKKLHRHFDIDMRDITPDVFIMLQVYDEIEVVAKNELAEQVSVMLADSMDKAARYFVPEIDMRPVPQISQYWIK